MSVPVLIFEGNVGSVNTEKFGENVKTTISIACNRKIKDKEEETHWFKIETWNASVDFLKLLETKAKSIYGQGELLTSTWDDGDKKKSREYISMKPSDIKVGSFKSEKE